MRRRSSWLGVGLAALAVGACGGNVRDTEEGNVAGSGGDGGASTVDPTCYDACVAKGGSPDECAFYCDKDAGTGGGKAGTGGGDAGTAGSTGGSAGTGGSTGGSAGTAGSTGGTGGGAAGEGGTGGKPDPTVEKSCLQCWDDAAVEGHCVIEAKTCEASLACTQLRWCPVLCGEPDCFEECNDIIPTGVAPLAALVQCMACADGPCAEECAGSVLLTYCK